MRDTDQHIADIGMTPKPERLLLLTAARINRLQDQVLIGLEVPLTSRQYRVLARVDEGHASPTALAKLARRSLPTLSETIDGLVRKGLLERTASEQDRRSVVLSVTDNGMAALKAADERMNMLAEDLIEALPPDATRQLSGYLEILYRTAERYLKAKA